MRISTLTRLSAGMLLLASLGMAVSVFWGLRQLQTPFRSNQDYFHVAEQISVETRRLIDNYLATGDASDLQAAQTFLASEVRTSLAALPEQLQATLLPGLEQLEAALGSDLRAAGKLAGDTQGLLLQNERETLDQLALLADYARQAPPEKAEEADRYRERVRDLDVLVARRAILRSSYFAAPSEALEGSLRQASEAITAQAEAIRQLASLGVWKTQEVDDFAAMIGGGDAAGERVEVGGDLKDGLVYTVRRYGDELANTATLIRDGQAARQRVAALVAELERQLDDGRAVLDRLKAVIEDRVMWLMSLFLLLLFVVAIATSWVQLSMLKGMGRVGAYLKHLGSGDFSRAMGESSAYGELQELRHSANQMQTYMHRLVSEIRNEVQSVAQASTDLDQVATAIHDGMAVQSQRTDEADGAIGQLAESFRLVANHALEASQAAEAGQAAVRASARVMQGLESSITALSDEVSQGAAVIGQLREESQSIEAVLNVIVAIAEQTNLLALNAAIEAARAGEHGRGFAVVADEVRQLAQRTAESVQEIRGTIDGLRHSSDQVGRVMGSQQGQAEQSVRLTREAASQLQQVVAAIEQIHGMNTLIAQATEEQASSATAVKEGVEEVQRHTRDVTERTAQARSQSDHLAGVGRDLNALVERFVI